MNPHDDHDHNHDHFDDHSDGDCCELKPNVSDTGRLASVLVGSALTLIGISQLMRKNWLGALPAVAGGALIARGATGYCPANAALGIEGYGTAQPNIGNHGYLSRDIPGHGGVLVEKSIVINRSRDELFAFWRQLENLPQVMQHLESVTQNGEQSHWVAKAPAGQKVEWDATIYREVPGELIAWRSLPGAQIPNSGSVRFKELAGNRGTEVRVILEYAPPAGQFGALVAKLFGEEPNLQVESDLRRFKQLMEAGETATTEGQPRG